MWYQLIINMILKNINLNPELKIRKERKINYNENISLADIISS